MWYHWLSRGSTGLFGGAGRGDGGCVGVGDEGDGPGVKSAKGCVAGAQEGSRGW